MTLPVGTGLRGPAASVSDAGDTIDPVPEDAAARRVSRLALASVVVALAPIFVALVRAIARHWLPVGDNGYFEIRARDVFTDHHPLLGTWTSASQSLGVDLNNPGPLQFDLLALPARFGRGSGLVFGVASVNAAAVVGIALVARRLGGARLVIAAMTMVAALAWTMGSELLFDPWQPHILLLPLLCYLVLAWAIFTGELVALPWAAFAASFLVQTHLSFSVLVFLLGGWAVAGLGWRMWRTARDDPDRAPAQWRRALNVGAITVAVLLVAWSQPLVEQLFGEGAGNLGRIASNVGNSSNSIGLVRGSRVAAAVLVSPPWWARPSFGESLLTPNGGPLGVGSPPEMAGLPSAALAMLGLVAALGLLAAVSYRAHRRGDRLVETGAATAAVAVGAAWVTAILLPLGAFGIPAHQLRFLWPVAIFATFSLALAVARSRQFWTGPAPRIFAAVVLVLSALNLPYNNNGAGATRDENAIPVMRQINAQLAALEGSGPLLFDLTGQRFAEPYAIAVQAELVRRGVPFLVSDEVLVRQLGESRRFEGEAAAKILVRDGAAARHDVPGATRVAFAEGLSDAKQEELADLRIEIAGAVADRGVRLNERGLAAVERGEITALDGPGVDTAQVLDDGVLVLHWYAGYLDVDEAWLDRFMEYIELQQQEDLLTVAVYLAPVTWTPESG